MLGLAASSQPLNQAQERLSPQSDDCQHLYLSQLRQQNSALVFTNQKHRKLTLPLKELFVPTTLFKRAARSEANGGLFTRISQVWKRTKAPEEEPIAQECDWSELFRERAIALIGEAGSGKSCLLRYIALRLSEITLENARAQLSELGLPISSEIPFPLLLRLDQLPASFREGRFSNEQLWRAFVELYPDLPADFFSQQLGQGTNLLLIDGIELLSQETATSLIQLLERLLRHNAHTQIIVSMRNAHYLQHQALLERFVQMRIAPFSKGQQRDFISNWSRFFHTRLRLPQADQLAFEWSERCWQQFEAVAAAQQLAENPALLGCLVMLAQHSAQLPQTRTQLYSACCDLLLLQTNEPSQLHSKRYLLEKIAYRLQLAQAQGLGLTFLRDQLSHDEQEALADLVQTSGLLEVIEDQQLAFCTPPFQPFLAANYIVEAGEQFVAELVGRSAEPAWHDCISFCFELLSQPEALALLERINQQHNSLEEQLEDLTISSNIVIRSDDREHLAALQDYLRQRAYTLWREQQEHPLVPQRCGELFGLLGDPRSGVCELPPAMVALPSAQVRLGYSEDELEQLNPQERFLLEDTSNSQLIDIEAFEIARYPISNAQFQAFIDDKGYEQRAWWDFGEITALQAHREQRGVANQAVTNITWYEAQAFCRWLTAYLDDGYIYSLPSEAEWEYAARGLERRHFAWGNELQTRSQNLSLRAVGCYLRDYTPSSIADLGTQILEWTRSSYVDYPYKACDGREYHHKGPQEELVCRGRIPGRLHHKPYAAYRYTIWAKEYDAWLGFRVIRRPKR